MNGLPNLEQHRAELCFFSGQPTDGVEEGAAVWSSLPGAPAEKPQSIERLLYHATNKNHLILGSVI